MAVVYPVPIQLYKTQNVGVTCYGQAYLLLSIGHCSQARLTIRDLNASHLCLLFSGWFLPIRQYQVPTFHVLRR